MHEGEPIPMIGDILCELVRVTSAVHVCMFLVIVLHLSSCHG